MEAMAHAAHRRLTQAFSQLTAALRRSEMNPMESALHKPPVIAAGTNWSKWVRQTHRWLSIAFTLAVIINFVAVVQKKYTNGLGLLAVFTLVLQFVTGLYLFVLPYAAKWRRKRSTD
jgi:heme A synthase